MHLIAGFKQRVESGFVVLVHPITGRELQLRKEESLVLPFINAAKSVAMVSERARDGGTDLPEQQLHALLVRLQVSGFLRMEARQTLQAEAADIPWAQASIAAPEEQEVTVQRSVDLALALAEAPVLAAPPVEDERPTSVDIDVNAIGSTGQFQGVPGLTPSTPSTSGLTPYTSGSWLNPNLRPELKPTLKFKQGEDGKVQVTDSASGNSAEVDELEVVVARKMDGSRTMSQLAGGSGLLAISAEQIESVVRQWRAYDFLQPFPDDPLAEDRAASLEHEVGPPSRARKLVGFAGLGVVALVAMRLIEYPQRLVEPCVVAPSHRHQLRSGAEGVLKSVEVKDGQLVKAGDLLFVFEDREPQAELARLDAEVATAEEAFARIKQASVLPVAARKQALTGKANTMAAARAAAARIELLVNKGKAPAAQLEKAEAKVLAAQQAHADAEAMMTATEPEALAARSVELEKLRRMRAEQAGRVSRLQVQSPISGTINIPGLEGRTGQPIAAGSQLAELVDLSTLLIEVRVKAEPDVLEVGQPVVFRPANDPARAFHSKIESIRPAEVGDPQGVVRVVARLDNAEGALGQGSIGKAEIDVGKRPILELATGWLRRVL